jgi:hypothetical protein
MRNFTVTKGLGSSLTHKYNESFKNMSKPNTLAYFTSPPFSKEKSFVTLTPELNVIKKLLL